MGWRFATLLGKCAQFVSFFGNVRILCPSREKSLFGMFTLCALPWKCSHFVFFLRNVHTLCPSSEMFTFRALLWKCSHFVPFFGNVHTLCPSLEMLTFRALLWKCSHFVPFLGKCSHFVSFLGNVHTLCPSRGVLRLFTQNWAISPLGIRWMLLRRFLRIVTSYIADHNLSHLFSFDFHVYCAAVSSAYETTPIPCLGLSSLFRIKTDSPSGTLHQLAVHAQHFMPSLVICRAHGRSVLSKWQCDTCNHVVLMLPITKSYISCFSE